MEAELADQPIEKSAAPIAEKVPEPVKPPLAAKPEPSKPVPVAAKPVAVKPAVLAKPKGARSVSKPTVVAKVPILKPPVSKPPVSKPIVSAKTQIKTTLPKNTPTKIAVPLKAPLTTEGKNTVTETFAKIEDAAKNFAAEATTKVKAAVEKGTKSVAELVEFSKGNVEAVVASGKIASKGAEEIAKYATDYGRTSIEKANATAKQFSAVKSPTEFFQLQSELAKSSLEAFVGETSKFGENYMKLLGEIAQPIQNRYALAVEKVKTAIAA